MAVKKRMSELLYSWKVGLPGEPKVNDAYNMLKEQGLVFDESAPKDPVSVLHKWLFEESYAAIPVICLTLEQSFLLLDYVCIMCRGVPSTQVPLI